MAVAVVAQKLNRVSSATNTCTFDASHTAASGNLLVAEVGADTATGPSSTPSGWSIIDALRTSNGNKLTIIYAKVSDGTETGIAVTWAASHQSTIELTEYSGADASGIVAGTTSIEAAQSASTSGNATVTMASVDPTPTGGVMMRCWIILGGAPGGTPTFDGTYGYTLAIDPALVLLARAFGGYLSGTNLGAQVPVATTTFAQQWLTVHYVITGSGGSTVTATAAATFGGTFAATAVVTVPVTAAAAFGGSFAATAVVTVPAAATADFGGIFAATATVTVPAVAAAAFGGVFVASATVSIPAVAGASFGFVAAATATVTVEAVAAASFGGVFTATAVVSVPAVAAAAFGGVFTASAGVTIVVTAIASFGGTFAATAVVTVPAVAVASFGGAFTAAATVSIPATAVASFGGVFTATATITIEATASAVFGGAFAAVIVVTVTVTAQASFGGTFTATATIGVVTAGVASAVFGGVFTAAGAVTALIVLGRLRTTASADSLATRAETLSLSTSGREQV